MFTGLHTLPIGDEIQADHRRYASRWRRVRRARRSATEDSTGVFRPRLAVVPDRRAHARPVAQHLASREVA